jgi:filamentous hemagglutinin family protein
MDLKINITSNHHKLTIKYKALLLNFFKPPAEKKNGYKAINAYLEKDQDKKNEFTENFILCRSCNHKITTLKEKISINGFHNHTFANPNGVIFDIGCFKNTPGCIYSGHFTDEFSWFKTYRWKVSICASCLTHLGWLFLSSNNDFFSGLIVDRIIESM